MLIKGVESLDTWDVTEDRGYSLEEIREILTGGKHSIFLVVLKYRINETPCIGSGLTLWDERHAPFLRDDKLVVSTYFRRAELGYSIEKGNPYDIIPVEVVIEPNEPILFISIRRVHVAPQWYEEVKS